MKHESNLASFSCSRTFLFDKMRKTLQQTSSLILKIIWNLTFSTTIVVAKPWGVAELACSYTSHQDSAAQGQFTSVIHLTWEKRLCESAHCPGEGRDVVAHKGPHVQFWDKKLEGRIGAGLLLSSGLWRHMVIICSSFEHAASLLMKRAVVQHESLAANTRANFLLLQEQKRRNRQDNRQSSTASLFI